MVDWQSPEVIALTSFIFAQETIFILGFYRLIVAPSLLPYHRMLINLSLQLVSHLELERL
jgi:hypothetical protein